MVANPLRQYRRHESEYNRIADALGSVRNLFESSDRDDKKVMLFDSSVFAVISVQNDISILRRAFRGYAQCENLDELQGVMKSVNYGNNKYDYIRHNKAEIQGSTGDNICSALENGHTWDAVDIIASELKGVSYIKASFIPAMLGYTDVMCIDTNVAQMVPDDGIKSKGYDNLSDYMDAVQVVTEAFPALNREVSVFMLQWIVFDANRDTGVARHEEWFEQMLPGTPFGRQMVLGSY